MASQTVDSIIKAHSEAKEALDSIPRPQALVIQSLPPTLPSHVLSNCLVKDCHIDHGHGQPNHGGRPCMAANLASNTLTPAESMEQNNGYVADPPQTAIREVLVPPDPKPLVEPKPTGYYCAFCDGKKSIRTRYSTLDNLDQHMKNCMFCPIRKCKKQFIISANLMNHLREDHKDHDFEHDWNVIKMMKLRSIVLCPKCKCPYYAQGGFQRHRAGCDGTRKPNHYVAVAEHIVVQPAPPVAVKKRARPPSNDAIKEQAERVVGAEPVVEPRPISIPVTERSETDRSGDAARRILSLIHNKLINKEDYVAMLVEL